MISSKSRAYYMGCSDADKIVGNRNTSTWEKWWQEKLGYSCESFNNKYTMAGTEYEHKILAKIEGNITMDYQLKKEPLCVRANFDGIDFDRETPVIYEVKTFKAEKGFNVSKTYWRQAQMEMWALGTSELYIVAYPLDEENYNNYWLDVDEELMQFHKIERDDEWIMGELIPNIKELAEYLKQGKWPKEAK